MLSTQLNTNFNTNSNSSVTLSNLLNEYRNPNFSDSSSYCNFLIPKDEINKNLYFELAKELSGLITFNIDPTKSENVKQLEKRYEELSNKQIAENQKEYDAKKEMLKALEDAIKAVDESDEFKGKLYIEDYDLNYVDEEGEITIKKTDPRNNIILPIRFDENGNVTPIKLDENGSLTPNELGENVNVNSIITYQTALKKIEEIKGLLTKKPTEELNNVREELNFEKAQDFIIKLENDNLLLQKLTIHTGGNFHGMQYNIDKELGLVLTIFIVKDNKGKFRPIALTMFDLNNNMQIPLDLQYITNAVSTSQGVKILAFKMPGNNDGATYFNPNINPSYPDSVFSLNETLKKITKNNFRYANNPKLFLSEVKAQYPNDTEVQNISLEDEKNTPIYKLPEPSPKTNSWISFLPAIGVAAAAGGIGGYRIGKNKESKMPLWKRRERLSNNIKGLSEVKDDSDPENVITVLTKVKHYMQSESINDTTSTDRRALTGLNQKSISNLAYKASEKEVAKLEKQFERIDNYGYLDDALQEIAKILTNIHSKQVKNSHQIV